MDALQEFRIQQNAFSAEYATGTAVINVAFKSGTNQFHGTAYEFLRNDKLDARNVFDRTPTLPPFRRNQFGVAAGGPIIPNKLFFFANYEGLRTRRTRTVFANVPTPAQLSGDFFKRRTADIRSTRSRSGDGITATVSRQSYSGRPSFTVCSCGGEALSGSESSGRAGAEFRNPAAQSR